MVQKPQIDTYFYERVQAFNALKLEIFRRIKPQFVDTDCGFVNKRKISNSTISVSSPVSVRFYPKATNHLEQPDFDIVCRFTLRGVENVRWQRKHVEWKIQTEATICKSAEFIQQLLSFVCLKIKKLFVVETLISLFNFTIYHADKPRISFCIHFLGATGWGTLNFSISTSASW